MAMTAMAAAGHCLGGDGDVAHQLGLGWAWGKGELTLEMLERTGRPGKQRREQDCSPELLAAGDGKLKRASAPVVYCFNWRRESAEASTVGLLDTAAWREGAGGHAGPCRRRDGASGACTICRGEKRQTAQGEGEDPGPSRRPRGGARWPGKRPGGGAMAGMLTTPTSCLPGLG